MSALDRALAGLTATSAAGLGFSRLVALVNEPNMPSGGGATVRRVLQLAPVRGDLPLIEVGSNTGYTTIEMASWVTAPVIGVDVDPVSCAFATAKAARHGIGNARFVVGDGLALPVADASCQLVFCSNVTSFMRDHDRASREYYRVLAPRGVLAAVPIHYHREPPSALRARVEEAIRAPLPVTSRDYWVDVFAHPRSTLIAEETYEYERRSDDDVEAYVKGVMAQPHLDAVAPSVRSALAERLTHFYRLFDENLSYARYSILLFRADHPNPEPVLHTSHRVAT
ncbi:class I SAM-dependent methyltransferase [Umezawaea sp. Da 62-37]|uniref:class I SAM-dependent methyltransferase n=1 Tax=Umezawaea sp. Da 62-37 TaxID=3075927 RepID=UPI0028F718A2|nr:class I SAM-dependent methyltransferase [Umezawaea sp. Da 62-37]WNV85803.1 class I SAM-dependent methyltransferase [Umezawaea sp. Da 62-37]